ncbi:Imm42 family immunity protein [Cupriavidus sp. YR651]|uniref:Imm42 family immunity protein n=1 Tax=Cupriavidus sp. YR651 TaxID=1855315 RepID=UPI000B8233EB|nr:Imm42 family immunity protein [Cupriavidus sp. YR651]
MLSGNPDTFAIWYDSVESWSTDRFKNGCFGYVIDGNLMWTTRSTIGVDLHMLAGLHCMTHAVEDARLFSMATSNAYSELCERALPSSNSDARNSDFTHLVSAESLSDDGYYVFLIESADQAKLIYGLKGDYGGAKDILLARGEFQTTVNQAIEKSKSV